MAKKILLIYFFTFFNNTLTCLYAQELTIEEEEYINNTLQIILESRIEILDTQYNRIDPLTLRAKYVAQDTVINDIWTRPRFVNNIYYDGFDGEIRLRKFPNFDTLTFTNSNQYIAFREYEYDEISGDYLDRKIAFVINRNDIPKSLSDSKKEFIICNNSNHNLNTNKKLIGNWQNYEVLINEKPYPLDSCLKSYNLELKLDFEFQQSYNGDTICYTNKMQPNIVVGVEGDPIYFDNYANMVQYCLIENKSGFWTTDSKYLLFYTQYGQEIYKLEIVYLSENLIELRTKNYQLKMKKIASR